MITTVTDIVNAVASKSDFNVFCFVLFGFLNKIDKIYLLVFLSVFA